MGGNTLQAMQIGLHVVGNNIANANTPGYVREEVIYSPAPVQKIGNLTLGLGVEVDAIVQQADAFLSERLRNAASDRASADVQKEAFADLEALIGELSDTDLSTSLSNFFNSIADISNNNGENTESFRNLAIGQGKNLTADIRRLATRSDEVRSQFDTKIGIATTEINKLTESIRNLNLRIIQAEGGGASKSDAGGLRTERGNALKRLAELIDIKVVEQPSGAVNIAVGGESLVFEATRREVTIAESISGGTTTSTLRFADNNTEIELTAGEVHGLLTARDDILGDFIDNLDDFTALLVFEFNKLYSQGQGAVGFTSLTSNRVLDPSAALDASGLPFTPVNGQFQIQVINTADGTRTTHDITIDLNGLDGDTTLASLRADLDAIEGITASIDTSNRLQLASDSSDIEFAFAGDEANESGALAALGLNTFFTGSTSREINVNAELDGVKNAAKFAAGLGSPDNQENALRLTQFYTRPLAAAEGSSLAGRYDQIINDITQRATIAQSVADGFGVFEATLQGEEQALSGVNIDEEAINMITLQRTYQASARFIQSISELLDVLVNL